jgi:hypothetical protein
MATSAQCIKSRLTRSGHLDDIFGTHRFSAPTGSQHPQVFCNGNLYCPATPKALLSLGPLARGASKEEQKTHDRSCGEPVGYKLGGELNRRGVSEMVNPPGARARRLR